MNPQRSTEIRVGAVTLLSLLLLIGGIMLGRGVNVSTGKSLLKIQFPNSGGLDASAPVFVNGVKRGAVFAVEPHQGGVLVTVALDNLADLKADASAKILMLEITGGRKIEIHAGTSSAGLAEGIVLQGQTTADISDVIALVGELGGDAGRIIRRIDTSVAALNSLLADGQVLDDVRQTMRHLRSVSGNADELLTSNRIMLQQTLNNLADVSADIKRLSRKDGAVDSLVFKLDRLVSDGRTMLKSVDASLRGVDKLVVQVDSIALDLRTRKSIANQVLFDETVGRRVDSLLATMKKFFDNLPYDGINVNVRLGSRP